MKQLRVLLGWFLILLNESNAFAGDGLRDSSFKISSAVSPGYFNPFARAYRFSLNPYRKFDFGLPTPNYCCVVIKAQSRVPADYILCVNNTSLDSVFIYRLQPHGPNQSLYAGGNAVSYEAGRECVWHTASLRLEASPTYYLLAVKAPSQNVNIDYQIMEPAAFRRWYRSLDRTVHAYAAFVLIIGLVCFGGGLLFRRKVLLVYTGYVLSLAGWILAHYGYLFPEVYPSFARLNTVIKQVTSLVSMFCLLSLVTLSFRAELQKRWLNAFLFLKLFSVALLLFYGLHLAGAFGAYNPAFVNILWNVSLLVSVCLIVTALAALGKANRTARLFCIAISLVSLTAVYQSLSNMGWLYNYFLNEHGMTMASVLEALLLAVGIFYNLWEEKNNKEQALTIAETERTRTLQMLIGVQEEERRRIAGDLHDSIGPMLAAIKINFMRLAKAKAEDKPMEGLVTKTEGIIEDSIAEIRAISHRLMPKSLSSKGLITLLADYFSGLEAVHGIRINFSHDINVSLSKEVQLNLYRMISELSLNAAKHSGAGWLCVSIKTGPHETVVRIKDDGTGFTKEAKNGATLGIKNVQSRVDYLKGKMQLVSVPGEGTNVQILIPHNGDSEFHQA